MASQLSIDKLFKKEYSTELGFYLVANVDFEEGQLICTEPPILNSPTEPPDSKVDVCVSCFKVITYPYIRLRCSKCQWPVCSTACENDLAHADMECSLFARKKILPTSKHYTQIIYIRVILSQIVYPDRYLKFMSLGSQFDEKTERKLFKKMTRETNASFNFLYYDCGLMVNLEELKKMWTIFTMNVFSIETGDMKRRVYLGNSFFEHSCRISHSCNFSVNWSHEKVEKYNGNVEWCITLYARRTIKKGEMLTIAYYPQGLDFGTGPRKEVFQVGYYTFSCLCSRCTDESEGGTYFSSLKCNKCKGGYLVPKVPLDSFSCQWKCKSCKRTEEAEPLQDKIYNIYEHLKCLYGIHSSGSSKDVLHEFIEENSGKTLHPNHFLNFKAISLWLREYDFQGYLIEESVDRAKMYLKIRERGGRAIRLTKMFMSSSTIVEFQLIVAQAIAAFAFKSPDGKCIMWVDEDPRVNYRYSKNILFHYTEAKKWLQMWPKMNLCELVKRKVAKRCSIWEVKHRRHAKMLEDHEEPFEQAALLKIRNLYSLNEHGTL